MSKENSPNSPTLGKIEQIEKKSFGGDSNTKSPPKQSNQYLYWSFTYNNYGENYDEFVENLKFLAIKGVVSKEVCPTTNTPHLQGFFGLKKKRRLSELKEYFGPKIHFEPTRSNEQNNLKYCSKDKKFVKWGFPDDPPPQIRVLEALRPWQEEIQEIYRSEPDDRTIYWFWEGTGNIGKSAFIKYMVVTEKVLFCSGGKHSDIINLVFNQDMNRCKAVFFNIPRAHKGKISYASLESIKDGMICNTKYETGVKVFNSPHIFILANFPPEKPENLSKDRWHIKEL